MSATREIDIEGPRVETGPVRLGDDWTGLFIRGDDCFALAMTLREGRIPSGLLELLDDTRERGSADGFR